MGNDIEFMGSANFWYADHNPTNNEVAQAPGSSPVMFGDFFLNTVDMRMFWCTDATPSAQKWNEIQQTPFV